jgi:hypothetical protein
MDIIFRINLILFIIFLLVFINDQFQFIKLTWFNNKLTGIVFLATMFILMFLLPIVRKHIPQFYTLSIMIVVFIYSVFLGFMNREKGE